eukprot:snap_masked-scaffold_50-processed-gene-0.9-mRNA-1 protein AED:1.00 eAED:1.00 QI:0/-1/0/0/-1/1/1/0/323
MDDIPSWLPRESSDYERWKQLDAQCIEYELEPSIFNKDAKHALKFCKNFLTKRFVRRLNISPLRIKKKFNKEILCVVVFIVIFFQGGLHTFSKTNFIDMQCFESSLNILFLKTTTFSVLKGFKVEYEQCDFKTGLHIVAYLLYHYTFELSEKEYDRRKLVRYIDFFLFEWWRKRIKSKKKFIKEEKILANKLGARIVKINKNFLYTAFSSSSLDNRCCSLYKAIEVLKHLKVSKKMSLEVKANNIFLDLCSCDSENIATYAEFELNLQGFCKLFYHLILRLLSSQNSEDDLIQHFEIIFKRINLHLDKPKNDFLKGKRLTFDK